MAMLKLQTHFEQVPLEMVTKIVENEIHRQVTSEHEQGTNEKKPEEIFPGNAHGQCVKENSLPFAILEISWNTLRFATAIALEDTEARAQELAAAAPGARRLLKQITGHKPTVKFEARRERPAASRRSLRRGKTS
jgi:hypothetical protein